MIEPLPPAELEAYFERIGHSGPRDADLPTLTALHRAHVERVPYETLQIALGRPPAVDADSSVASVLRGQGGYCFHLNGAFAWLLSRLGYAVQHHRAGVQGARAVEPVGADGNHLALTVDLAGQPWLVDVGLGYVRLGQPATTLSGGEAQRVKLAAELQKRSTGRTIYVLDEPTTGLHFEDIRKLLQVLQSLVDKGNTVVVIEHNLDVIKAADWVIDLGPEGGSRGGMVVAEGTPEQVADNPASFTGAFLKDVLDGQRVPVGDAEPALLA